MWLINFLPDWIFHILLIVSLVCLVFTSLLAKIPVIGNYPKAARPAAFLVFAFCLWIEGGISNNNSWLARVAEMEAKVAKAEEQTKEQNTKIETKVVNKVQVVKQRGEAIVQYVDREVTKYDTQCVIPKEFVKAHNDAAEKPK